MENFKTILEEEATKNGLDLWDYLEKRFGTEVIEERKAYNVLNEIISENENLPDIILKKNMLYIAVSSTRLKKRFGHDFISLLKKTENYRGNKYISFFGEMRWSIILNVNNSIQQKGIEEIKEEIINMVEKKNKNIVIKDGWIYIPLCNDRFEGVLNIIDRNDRDVCIKNVHIPDMGVTQRCVGVYCGNKIEGFENADKIETLYKKIMDYIYDDSINGLYKNGIETITEDSGRMLLKIKCNSWPIQKEVDKNYESLLKDAPGYIEEKFIKKDRVFIFDLSEIKKIAYKEEEFEDPPDKE